MRLSEEIIEQICLVLRAGNTESTAAHYVGIAPATLSVWKRRHGWVRDEINKARAGTKIALVNIVQQAARKDWRAAAWILERTWPEDYAPRDKHEISGELAVRYRAIIKEDGNVVCQPVTG